MKSGDQFKANNGTDSIYTVLNVEGDSVEVLREPRPLWAGSAWISMCCFDAVADLRTPLTTD